MDADQVTELIRLESATTPYSWSDINLLDSLEAGHCCMICLSDDHLAGYFVVRDLDHAAEILNFVVFSAFQGRGLGNRMVEKIVADARLRGKQKIWLEVRCSNQFARRLYARAGFTHCGTRKNYYRLKESSAGSKKAQFEDAFLMEYQL